MSRFAFRLLAVIAVIAVIAIGILLWLVLAPGPMDFAGGHKVALADYRGANPTGVPASLANASVVKRGEYLTRAADCISCHTAKGGREFAGGFAFTLPFGTIWSTNITPDRETGIGNYSDADFLNAVHRGIRRDGRPLYPAMPFTSYSTMTDADALAIKAYLFSLAPVHAPHRSNTLAFPFNHRRLVAVWSWLFNADRRYEPNADRSAEWNRGAYLAEALAHCGECHTPRTLALSVDNRRKFAGAITGGWRAWNITPDRGTGIGAWSDAGVYNYLAQGHATGHGTASGSMGEAVEYSFVDMTPDDLRAIVTYLRAVAPHSSPDLPAALAPPAPASPKRGAVTADALGKHLFEGACAACHGWTGQSAISPFATLTGARAVNDPGATNVAQIVISGTRRTTPAGAISMPAFGAAFTDAEIAAVANYVTARFGTKGSSLSVRDVASLRHQSAQP
ncbi:MAG TPA: cytochrome c [Rhizomicrobium sp.]|jgi:mono/diheme cytochrome c family protein|nr:cytochrome c [Rhizomicrobium sp.]